MSLSRQQQKLVSIARMANRREVEIRAEAKELEEKLEALNKDIARCRALNCEAINMANGSVPVDVRAVSKKLKALTGIKI